MLMPVLIIFFIREMKSTRSIWLMLVLLVLLFLAPFSLVYLNGSELPCRILVALPLLTALVWWLLYPRCTAWGQKILLVGFFLFISNTTAIKQLFRSTWVSWQADRDMANRIYERICTLDLEEELKIHRLCLPDCIIGHPMCYFSILKCSESLFSVGPVTVRAKSNPCSEPWE